MPPAMGFPGFGPPCRPYLCLLICSSKKWIGHGYQEKNADSHSRLD
ncbi:unnamed protein product [Musa hybrid cultivar]